MNVRINASMCTTCEGTLKSMYSPIKIIKWLYGGHMAKVTNLYIHSFNIHG